MGPRTGRHTREGRLPSLARFRDRFVWGHTDNPAPARAPLPARCGGHGFSMLRPCGAHAFARLFEIVEIEPRGRRSRLLLGDHSRVNFVGHLSTKVTAQKNGKTESFSISTQLTQGCDGTWRTRDLREVQLELALDQALL